MHKNLIFDLGGILIDIFPERAIAAFKALGFKNEGFALQHLQESHFFETIELIPDSEKRLCEKINTLLKKTVPTFEIVAAWNALLGDFNTESVEVVKKLSQTHRCFLLSNTNSVHFEDYTQTFKSQFGIGLNSMFEKTYFSHELGMRKPNTDIFTTVLEEQKLQANETLFIDDMPENRFAAQKIGIKTIEIKTNEGLKNVLIKNRIISG